MHRTLLAAAGTTAAALVLTAVTVAPAQAASYAVSIKTSRTQADVGGRFTLSGQVTGRGSGGKTVYIQRRTGSGGWSNVTTTKTSSKGTYKRQLGVTSVGAKQYRVVATATSTVGRGESPAVTVTGFTWLYLADQPTTANGAIVDVPVTVGGATYRKSLVLLDDFAAVWNLDGQCDVVTSRVAIDQRAASDAPSSVIVGMDTFEKSVVRTATAVKNATAGLNAATTGVTGMTIGVRSGESSQTTPPIDVLTPKAHCSTTQLPTWDFSS